MSNANAPNPVDGSTLPMRLVSPASAHELIDSLYEGINALDTSRLETLFLTGIRLVRAGPLPVAMTIEQWLAGLPTLFVENEEVELSRLVEVQGLLAQVRSRFLIRHRRTKASLRSGTNLLTLVQVDGVWRFAAAVWASEPASTSTTHE